MKAFLDFEASSLADRSFPIEVAWVFEDGRSEAHLIRPAPGCDDWDAAAEALHGIDRDNLANEGEPHEDVALRMVEELSGHDLFASAPSWDGKWMSVLLRGAGYPRHTLRLRDSDHAARETASAILEGRMSAERAALEIDRLLDRVANREVAAPVHRALPDAQAEHERWALVARWARELVQGLGASE